jgi:2',3'-cyclic-nucleotide 2'-phosphodiesterase (5'-nucleotidase family)
VLSTNDVHGRLFQLPLFGGYVRNLRAARARDGGVLLLDAGDIFQGTLESNASEGASMIRAYNALGYDAAALGNHEFDFGPAGPHQTPQHSSEDPLGAIKARLSEAHFPFLNLNLRRADGSPLAIPRLRASVLLDVGGVRVGVLGGVTKDVLRTTHPGNTRGLAVVPLAPALAEQAASLRKQGARVVVALVHAGGDCKQLDNSDDLSSCDDKAEAFALARALPAGSVDLIVAGHTHAGVAQRVSGVPIIEAFSNGRAFGRADLEIPPVGALQVRLFAPQALCNDDLDQPSCAEHETYEAQPVARDERVLTAIAADVRRAKAIRDKPVGVEVVGGVSRASKIESPLNNLVADLMLRASPGADAAFSNGGAVRIPLPAGPLRYGTLFEMFPFDNSFATLHITARQLADIVRRNLSADNGMLSLAGVRASAHCQAGLLAIELFDSAGAPIAPERSLTVITSDFLATDGDGLLVGLGIVPPALTFDREHLIRDALLQGIKAMPGGRIDGQDKRLFDPDHPRVRYTGTRPLRCSAN